jgi:hypothetical protein
MNKTSGPSKLF